MYDIFFLEPYLIDYTLWIPFKYLFTSYVMKHWVLFRSNNNKEEGNRIIENRKKVFLTLSYTSY